MDQEKYISLLHKQQQGTIDAMEQSALEHWLQQAEINRVLAEKIKEEWDLTAAYEPPISFDLEEEYTALQQRIQVDDASTPKQALAKVVPINRTRNWLSWAAAIALVIGVGTWFMSNQANSIPQLTVDTDISEKKEVLLADGTKVWLNENSQLHYPTAFSGEQRKVQLTGEAFFDVHKDASKPFIIETASSEVKVLGTSFNVRALKKEAQTEVVVQTGKVQLSSLKNQQSVLLVANEKGIHQHRTNTVQKLAEQDMNELAWKSQVLLFKGTPIPEVLENLERLFDVSFVANTSSLSQCRVTGRFPNPAVDVLLKTICKDFDIRLKEVSDKEYELIGGNCE